MDEIEFSVPEASAILKRTMKSLGYDDEMADLGVWSALWLEQRFDYGVTQLIVYLALVSNLDFDDLKPRRHPEHVITGICPFMLSAFIAERESLWMKKGGVAFGAPASPNLLAPAITDFASAFGKSVRIRHREYSCLYSKGGIEFENDNFGTFGAIVPDDNGPMVLTLTDDRAEGKRCLKKVSLPARRLRKGGILDLG